MRLEASSCNKTSQRLFEKVSVGKVSTIEVVRTAQDIVADYGDQGDEVSAWASLGTGGKYPGNVHAELIKWGRTMGVHLELGTATVTCKNRRMHVTIMSK